MRRRLITAALVVAFSSGLVASPAQGDPDFSEGRPDKGVHSYCFTDGFTSVGTANDTMQRIENQTPAEVRREGCDNETDVRWSNREIPGAFGAATCYNRNTSGTCASFTLRLNNSNIETSSHPASQRRKTACHEAGHTLGVSHYAGNDLPGYDTEHSCLRTGYVGDPDQPWHTTYGVHHKIWHINPWFS